MLGKLKNSVRSRLGGNAHPAREWIKISLEDYKECEIIRRLEYLWEEGWIKSIVEQTSVDANGQPLPWITYSAIRFLEPRIMNNFQVFEFGSGNSTRWWSSRTGSVISCEHDEQWFDKMRPQLDPNVEYHLKSVDDGTDYQDAIVPYKDKFHCVVIDGVNRVECALNSLASLRQDGVIVWDNSERTEYQEGFDYLSKHNFRRIDFWGIGPINPYQWCTSVFYRNGNCLGL